MDLAPVKAEILKQVEMFIESKFADGTFDSLMSQLLVKIEEVIPGKIDDAVIEAIKPILVPMIKEWLLVEIKKIG